MFKPSKFIWKHNKTNHQYHLIQGTQRSMLGEKEVASQHSSMKLSPPTIPAFGKKHTHAKALENEIYELSIVNGSGVFLGPLSSDNKHNQWLCVNDDHTYYFFLPSHDCLTTASGRPHSFYTPSSIITFA